MESQNVVELRHSQPLSSEDLLVLEEHRQDVAKEASIIEPKGLTSKIISEVFCYFKADIALLENLDLDFERSLKVSVSLEMDYASYREIYREKKRLSCSQP